MQKPILIENIDGKFLVLPNDTLGQHLARGERWEPHILDLAAKLLQPGDIAVDVGANIGYNAVSMARNVGPQGKVFAFEPLRITFQQLCGNIFLNGLENVSAFHCAIGPANDVTVSMVPVNYEESNVNIMNACVGIGGEFVQMRTLDSFELSAARLLKIDVQGCEPAVLKGAATTIRRCRPVMLIEIEEPQLKNLNSSSEELMMDVFSLGYNLIYFGSMCDWVAVPVESEDLLNTVSNLIGPAAKVFLNPT